MITVAVIAVLAAIAVPNFKRTILSNRLGTVANQVVLAAKTARIEAIKRNATTLLCTDGSVYVGACGGTGTKVRAPIPGLDTTVRINGGSLVGLSFSPQGMARQTGGSAPYGGTVADVCTASLATDNHHVVQMVGGTILTVTKQSGGTCQ